MLGMNFVCLLIQINSHEKTFFYAIGENLNIDYLLNDIKEVIIFDITMTTLVLKEMLAY